MSHHHRTDRAPSPRWASALGTVYATTLVWLVRAPSGADGGFLSFVEAPWKAPAALLAAQILSLAGLLHLFLGLRRFARRLERGREPIPKSLRPFWIAALPVALALGAASGIAAGARGLSYRGLVFWTFAPAALVLILRRLTGPLTIGEPNPQEALRRAVSRLRGASMVTAVAGLALFVASSSLISGALLPLIIVRELPHAPPPQALTTTGDASAGGGGGTSTRTATEAGRAIQTLVFAGALRDPDPLELPPERRLPAWWDGDEAPPLPFPPHQWARSLHAAATGGHVSTRGLRFMEALSNRPANQEFDDLALATRADITGTRWRRLDGMHLASFELPVPRYAELWTGVRARLAGAFYLDLSGHELEARRRVETVVQLGRLLYADGPLSLDALVGAAIIREGLSALESLEGAQGGVVFDPPPPTAPPRRNAEVGVHDRLAWLAAHRVAVESATSPRGARWEAFMLLQTFQPCASLNAVLWGPTEDARAWSRSVSRSLTVHPSEQAMAELLAEGYLGTRAGVDGWGWLPRVLAVTLAERPVVSHCAPLAATIAGG